MRVRDLRTGEILVDIPSENWFLETLDNGTIDAREGFRLELEDMDLELLKALVNDLRKRVPENRFGL